MGDGTLSVSRGCRPPFLRGTLFPDSQGGPRLGGAKTGAHPMRGPLTASVAEGMQSEGPEVGSRVTWGLSEKEAPEKGVSVVTILTLGGKPQETRPRKSSRRENPQDRPVPSRWTFLRVLCVETPSGDSSTPPSQGLDATLLRRRSLSQTTAAGTRR